MASKLVAALQLEIKNNGEWKQRLAHRDIEPLRNYVKGTGFEWRIVRTSDNVVIAQSKQAVDQPPAPVADDSEPTARDAMLASEAVLADSWNSDADEQAFAALSEPLCPAGTDAVVAETATAEDAPQPVSRVQWLTREDLHPYLNVQFSFGVQRVSIPQPTRYFNERIGYTYLQDREEAPQKPRSAIKRGSQGRTPMNMQKRLKSTPVARQPLQARETVLEIVSRVLTPLTSQTRRVA